MSDFDPGKMGNKISEFSKQILKGWEIGENAGQIPSEIDNILFAGMGGSAIAGDIINSFFSGTLSVPFVVNRGYDVPGFISSKTLFIASSYSGNTEETLSAFDCALKKGVKVIAVTSGGKLAEICDDRTFPVFKMPEGYPPRSALGFSMGILFNILSKANIISLSYDEVKEAAESLSDQQNELSDINGPAAVLAKEIAGTLPFIYGSVHGTDVIALRWKAQFNENSKIHAAYGVFSEMNHNEIMGWAKHEKTGDFFKDLSAVFLRSTSDSARNVKRMDITKDILNDQGVKTFEVKAKGNSKIAEFFYLISFGDWTSYHLAFLNEVDPTEIPAINVLKRKLAEE